MLNREKRGHRESMSNRLPIQTSGQGIYGKHSGLDVAWVPPTPAAGRAAPSGYSRRPVGESNPHFGPAARGTELHGGGGRERK